jgi:hypothetical protein
MKYTMFAKSFPAYHPRAGEPTYFVQKILYAKTEMAHPGQYKPLSPHIDHPKFHTIRGGSRWKVGDIFSARVWEGVPYRSKQKEFAQLQVHQIWDIAIDENGVISMAKPGEQMYYIPQEMYDQLAHNDGLDAMDFDQWLIMPVFRSEKFWKGQVICWHPDLNYSF